MSEFNVAEQIVTCQTFATRWYEFGRGESLRLPGAELRTARLARIFRDDRPAWCSDVSVNEFARPGRRIQHQTAEKFDALALAPEFELKINL